MSGRTYRIQASDGRFWSGDFSTTIQGTSIKTMKLLSSVSESFQLTIDESGWYRQIVMQPLNVYLQWALIDGHVALTKSNLGPGEKQMKAGEVPPAPAPLTFKVWGNDRLDTRLKLIISTSNGLYLTRAQGSTGTVCIDGTDTITSDCIFTLV